MALSAARISHVNLMTDTVVANLSPEGLRAILRSMLAADEDRYITTAFQTHVQRYLRQGLRCDSMPTLFSNNKDSNNSYTTAEATMVPIPTPELEKVRKYILSLIGSGLVFESLGLLDEVLRQGMGVYVSVVVDERGIDNDKKDDGKEEVLLLDALATVDGDLVQALTAVQKLVSSNVAGDQVLYERLKMLRNIERRLGMYRLECEGADREFPFERGWVMLGRVLAECK